MLLLVSDDESICSYVLLLFRNIKIMVSDGLLEKHGDYWNHDGDGMFNRFCRFIEIHHMV